MKYSKRDFIHLFAILMSTVLLYLTIHELRVALSGFSVSAQDEPCTTATPTPSNSPSATPSASPSPSPTASPSPSPTATPLPPQTILLTEFMACPESGNEWLELYNSSDSPITITNWQIIDAANNKKTINGTISPHAFSTFEWSGSLLNNAGDSFTIQTATGQILAQATYESCTPGISFVYENCEWIGAIASPDEETKVSQTTVGTSTASARVAQQSAVIDIPSEVTEYSTNEIDSISTQLPYSTPSFVTTSPDFSPPSLNNTSFQQAKHSTVPAISVILGGALQLLTASYTVYETFFKNHV